MRSVIQRYQAGDSSMRGKTGPNMKMLPNTLPKNRVTTKYRPRTDTAMSVEKQWKRGISFTNNPKLDMKEINGMTFSGIHSSLISAMELKWSNCVT